MSTAHSHYVVPLRWAWRGPDRACRATACGYCNRPPVFATGYRYIPAKGRVADVERYVCRDHAARFAAAHGLPMPTRRALAAAADVAAAVDLAATVGRAAGGGR